MQSTMLNPLYKIPSCLPVTYSYLLILYIICSFTTINSMQVLHEQFQHILGNNRKMAMQLGSDNIFFLLLFFFLKTMSVLKLKQSSCVPAPQLTLGYRDTLLHPSFAHDAWDLSVRQPQNHLPSSYGLCEIMRLKLVPVFIPSLHVLIPHSCLSFCLSFSEFISFPQECQGP